MYEGQFFDRVWQENQAARRAEKEKARFVPYRRKAKPEVKYGRRCPVCHLVRSLTGECGC